MRETRAFIFGAGGHAQVIASLVRAQSITFVVLDATAENTISEQAFFERIEEYRSHEIYVGIGANDTRVAIFNRLVAAGIRPATCVAPNAFIASTAQIGAGVVICPGSAIMANAVLGDNVIVNTLSSVDHDCVVGAHSQITAGVTFAGNVTVGEKCFFGIKSAVVPGVTIGDNVSIMAGSLVVADVPSNVLAGGNPARIVRHF